MNPTCLSSQAQARRIHGGQGILYFSGTSSYEIFFWIFVRSNWGVLGSSWFGYS